jgi:hypothetical protein
MKRGARGFLRRSGEDGERRVYTRARFPLEGRWCKAAVQLTCSQSEGLPTDVARCHSRKAE